MQGFLGSMIPAAAATLDAGGVVQNSRNCSVAAPATGTREVTLGDPVAQAVCSFDTELRYSTGGVMFVWTHPSDELKQLVIRTPTGAGGTTNRACAFIVWKLEQVS